MPTVRCIGCGREVSVASIACPNCQTPIGYKEGTPAPSYPRAQEAERAMPILTSLTASTDGHNGDGGRGSSLGRAAVRAHYCPNCGSPAVEGDRFCSSCGHPFQTEPQELRYRISALRVVLISFLSGGLYLFYWLFLTWKQYRDHSREEGYPVWHALTQFVPIYGLYRFHAHVRSYKELLDQVGLRHSLSPGRAVVTVVVTNVMDYIVWNSESVSPLLLAIHAASVVIVAGLLFAIQSNLNRYWAHLPNVVLREAKVGFGEVVFAIVGVLIWLSAIGSVLDAANPGSGIGV